MYDGKQKTDIIVYQILLGVSLRNRLPSLGRLRKV